MFRVHSVFEAELYFPFLKSYHLTFTFPQVTSHESGRRAYLLKCICMHVGMRTIYYYMLRLCSATTLQLYTACVFLARSGKHPRNKRNCPTRSVQSTTNICNCFCKRGPSVYVDIFFLFLHWPPDNDNELTKLYTVYFPSGYIAK